MTQATPNYKRTLRKLSEMFFTVTALTTVSPACDGRMRNTASTMQMLISVHSELLSCHSLNLVLGIMNSVGVI